MILMLQKSDYNVMNIVTSMTRFYYYYLIFKMLITDENGSVRYTFCSTQKCTSSDPTKTYCAPDPRNIESVLQPKYKIFPSKFLGPILCMLTNLFRPD